MRLSTLSAVLALALLGSHPTHTSAAEYRIANRDVAGLISALQQANRSPGPHHIQLHPGGIYTLQLTDSEGLGLPPIRSRIEIHGNGAEIRRYSDTRMTLLEVAAEGDAKISRLTLAEGSLGALRNRGRLQLDEVTITDSHAEQARAIVLNYGDLQIDRGLIGYNRVQDMGRDCGVVLNLGQLNVRRTRFIDNQVSRSAPGAAAAGAILNFGQLQASELSFIDNAVADLFGGLSDAAVVNLDSGQVHGLEPQFLVNERPSL